MPATYEPIATSTLGTAASSITLSGISGSYTDLRLVFFVQGNGSNIDVGMQVNGSATGYSYTRLLGSGTAANSDKTNSATIVYLDTLVSGTVPSLYVVDFFNYSGSTNKTFAWTQNEDKNGSGNVGRCIGLWQSTSAITSIRLGDAGTMAAGTTASLYGILRA